VILRETTVAASVFADMAEQLREKGVAMDDWCRLAQVDPALLTRPHERLPGSATRRLWEAGATLTGDPLLGLHVAEHFRTGAINILGYVFLNCRSGIETLDRLARFAALLNDGLRVRVSHEDALSVVHLEAVEGMDNFLLHDGRHVMETMAAGVVVSLRRMIPSPFIPAQVWFRHAAAGALDEYHRIFGAPVRFGKEENRVAFRATELSQAIPAADPSLLALFEGHAIARLQELERHGPVSQRVLRLLAVRLAGVVPDVSAVASEMATSGRQLQRRLRDEGASFQALLDEARRDVALAQLRTPGVTSAEVALLLGFSEASAFSRAFRRWTGTTPGAWASAAEAA